ncbi:STAS domain-containing protein [Micromonospora cathayae]|uniref:STAS domain-containing protein n=1 Tax=Micromonospora cathayae TaxID=3028804 RepID=A0ABY7ZKK4_9ACTN|nr:STAS domain-containing protein [Micromonospora sp. HUAS 3]WDZ82628.1 STAS domain-containing protein [Micromonospora sp. HUAS 3]
MDGSGRGDGGEPVTELAEIVVTEPLDLTGVRELGTVIDSILALGPARLVIDVSACPHVDAAGIGLLLDTHRRMWRIGGRLALRNPTPRIRRLLQVARVDQVFHVLDAPSSPAPADPVSSGPAAPPTAPPGPASAGPAPAAPVTAGPPAGPALAGSGGPALGGSGGRAGDVPRAVAATRAARGRARVVVPVHAR